MNNNKGAAVPTKAEWEIYKQQRMGERRSISDGEYLLEPRYAVFNHGDPADKLHDMRELWTRTLETEPFWEARPVESWECLSYLRLVEEGLREHDYDKAVNFLDNVIRLGTEDISALNRGIMMKFKAMMLEELVDGEFAGEVFPIYRGRCEQFT